MKNGSSFTRESKVPSTLNGFYEFVNTVCLFEIPVGMCSRQPRKTLAMASATELVVLSSRPADQKGMLSIRFAYEVL